MYAQTLFYGYVFDDPIVITQNKFTCQGIWGIKDILTKDSFAGIHGAKERVIEGGRYRPFSLVTFAIEYQFWGANPHLSHAINVVLYGFTGALLFNIFLTLVTKKTFGQWLDEEQAFLRILYPFVLTMIYVMHPVHTEVVANIKERDDILSFLFALLALRMAIDCVRNQNKNSAWYCGIFFFLSLLSKENGITFLAIFPLTFYTFLPRHTCKGADNNSTYTRIGLVLVLVAGVYLVLRSFVLGGFVESVHLTRDLMNNPFLNVEGMDRFATICQILGIYLKLLLLPMDLTIDYYPYHVPIVSMGDFRAVVPLLGYSLLSFYALIKIREKNLKAFGILFYLISLSIFTNLFFQVGTFMAERFLYVASLGGCIVFADMLFENLPYATKKIGVSSKGAYIIIGIVLLCVLSGFAYKTITRNFAWKDDFTLYATDVKTSDNSAKSHHVMGELYLQKARKEKPGKQKEEYYRQSIYHSQRGIAIHSKYVRCLFNLGCALFEFDKKNAAETLGYLLQVVDNNPNYNPAYAYMQIIFEDQTINISMDDKIRYYERLFEIVPDRYEVNSLLGAYYLFQNQLEKAELHLKRCLKGGHARPEDYNNMGVLNQYKGNLKKALDYFLKARNLAPDVDQYRQNYDLILRLLKGKV